MRAVVYFIFGGLDVVSEKIQRGTRYVLKAKGRFLLMPLSGGSTPKFQRVCPCAFSTWARMNVVFLCCW